MYEFDYFLLFFPSFATIFSSTFSGFPTQKCTRLKLMANLSSTLYQLNHGKHGFREDLPQSVEVDGPHAYC